MSTHMGEILLYFFYIRDQMKVYHFTTNSYARHIASDTFVNNLTLNLDLFLEAMQGHEGKRLKLPNKKFQLKNETDKSIVNVLKEFRKWLIRLLPKQLSKNMTDLINIRDEMLSDVDKTLYLFTFN